MENQQSEGVARICAAAMAGEADAMSCFQEIVDAVGWRWGLLVFMYTWLSFLAVLQWGMVRLFCGRLRAIERGVATKRLMMHIWRSLVFTNVMLAPKDLREWSFWLLWFSSSGLLLLLQVVGQEHFEHVVDNPRLGVTHTLRALFLHVLVLFGVVQLGVLGWAEFYHWGQGSVGQTLLSPASLGSGDGVSSTGWRGGTAFVYTLLFELMVTGADCLLSAVKYLINLAELYKDPIAAYADGTTEPGAYLTRLILAIMSLGRTLCMFRCCGHRSVLRKMVVWLVCMVNGWNALGMIHRESKRVVLAGQMDVAFPDATEKELKNMAEDEACAICLKTMASAKRLQCQHFFHAGCLRQYLNNSAGSTALCPICRTAIPWYPIPVVKPGQTLVDGVPPPIPPTNALPGGNVRTPDSFSRAARGANLVALIVRRAALSWRIFTDADGSAAAAAAAATAAAATPAVATDRRQSLRGGSTTGAGTGAGAPAVARARLVSPGREARGAAGEVMSGRGGVEVRVGRPGGDSSEVEAVALQLLEIFPDLGRQVALRSARAARGSVERAVELTLGERARGETMMSAGEGAPRQEGAAGERGVGESGGRDAVGEGGTVRRRWRGL